MSSVITQTQFQETVGRLNYNEVTDSIMSDAALEAEKGLSTGSEFNHKWVSGGDQAFLEDTEEGGYWEIGGHTFVPDQSVSTNRGFGSVVYPISRQPDKYEEYPIRINGGVATVAASGAVDSGYNERLPHDRYMAGITCFLGEDLTDEAIYMEFFYGSTPTGNPFYSSLGVTRQSPQTVTGSAGDSITLWLRPPIELDTGRSLYYRVMKADGSVLQLRPTNEDGSKPFYSHNMRKFEDKSISTNAVYRENKAYETGDLIWRVNSVLISRNNFGNGVIAGPFILDEWEQSGTGFRVQTTGAPTAIFGASSKVTLDSAITIPGDFQIQMQYEGSAGATPYFVSGDDYIKRDSGADDWIISIDSTEYAINNATELAAGDIVVFKRDGTTFEVYINGVSQGTQTVPETDFVFDTIGNTATPASGNQAGIIHDVIIVDEFRRLCDWWPMQEDAGTDAYNVISDNNGTYTNITWGNQDSTNHARSYGVRISGGVNIPARPFSVGGTDAADGNLLTHSFVFGDNECGVGEILFFEGESGEYVETGSISVTGGSPISPLPCDGAAFTEELPAGNGLWDTVNNKTNFPDDGRIKNYAITTEYDFSPSVTNATVSIQIRLAASPNTVVHEWDDIFLKNTPSTRSKELTIKTTEDVRTKQLEIVWESDKNGTLTRQKIFLAKY